MKKIISSLSVAALAVTLTLAPTKKAEAGVVIGNPAVIMVAVLPFLTGVGILSQGTDFLENDDAVGWTLLGLGFAAGVLDNNQTTNKNLNKIPSYLLQEIHDRAALKAEGLHPNANGIKEITFTNAEVDDIFELADESTPAEQLNVLRKTLTTKVI